MKCKRIYKELIGIYEPELPICICCNSGLNANRCYYQGLHYIVKTLKLQILSFTKSYMDTIFHMTEAQWGRKCQSERWIYHKVNHKSLKTSRSWVSTRNNSTRISSLVFFLSRSKKLFYFCFYLVRFAPFHFRIWYRCHPSK